jgi:hypothetical protein
MKQTAVEWLYKQIYNEYKISIHDGIMEQAKEMEKQQIIDSYEEGYLQCTIYGLPQKSRKHFEDSEQYYNETFKNL